MHINISNLAKADIFVQCFQHMKTFTDSINISFNSDHMFIQSMDSSMVIIMEFRLSSSWFDLYEVNEAITIGLSTNIWSKVLNVRDKSQMITLSSCKDNDYLAVEFDKSESKVIFDKSFEIPLISLDVELLHIPKMDYQAEWTLPCGTFASMVSQLKQFGDNLFIECSEEHIQLISDSQDYGKMNTHIPIDDLEEYSIEEGSTINSSFGLKMLYNVCLYQKISKSLSISISENQPMCLEYIMEEGAKLVFHLAPRIDDEA